MNEKKAILTRISDDGRQTLGHLKLINGKKELQLVTLELPWKDNERQKSCIPKGVYEVKLRWSPKYGTHYHVLNVPNRDLILIHSGNFNKDTKGCILVGKKFADINKDGLLDVAMSRDALNEMLKFFDLDDFTLEII